MQWGLVLEGGGTKGAYHLGVMRLINELGFQIKYVVGTSIGAVNGALFVQDEMRLLEKIWNDITVSDIIAFPEKNEEIKNVFDISNIKLLASELLSKKGLDITPFEKLLRSSVDENKIRNSGMEFGLATFSLTEKTGKTFFMDDIPKGELVDYILASACFPGFQPKNIAGNMFIDGGITNKLPIDMLIKKGCRNIITVEVNGVGFVKKMSAAGCNVIQIRNNDGTVGTLDFNRQGITSLINTGYYDAMKAFGLALGDEYSFEPSDYLASKLKYGNRIITGMQSAAAMFGINKFTIYRFDELCRLVIEKFNSMPVETNYSDILKWNDSEKITGLARAIINSDSELLQNKLVADILGVLFDAASAIAYFRQNIQ